MNKKGQVLIYSLMIGLVVVILALALSPSVKTFTDTAMNSDNLDCSNDSISNFDKATCVAVDLGGFYLIGALILIGGGFVAVRLLW